MRHEGGRREVSLGKEVVGERERSLKERRGRARDGRTNRLILFAKSFEEGSET